MDGAWVLRDPGTFDAAASSFRAARVQHADAKTLLRRGAASVLVAIAAEAHAGGLLIQDRGDFTKLYIGLVLNVPSLASAYNEAELDEFKRQSLPASVRFGRPLTAESRFWSRRLVNHLGYMYSVFKRRNDPVPAVEPFCEVPSQEAATSQEAAEPAPDEPSDSSSSSGSSRSGSSSSGSSCSGSSSSGSSKSCDVLVLPAAGVKRDFLSLSPTPSPPQAAAPARKRTPPLSFPTPSSTASSPSVAARAAPAPKPKLRARENALDALVDALVDEDVPRVARMESAGAPKSLAVRALALV